MCFKILSLHITEGPVDSYGGVDKGMDGLTLAARRGDRQGRCFSVRAFAGAPFEGCALYCTVLQSLWLALSACLAKEGLNAPFGWV